MDFDYSFEGLKNIYDRYELYKKEDGSFVVKDKLFKKIIEDTNIINMTKFALIWFKTMGNPVGIPVADYDFKTRYNYAFSETSKNIYDNMNEIIKKELVETGDIDILELVNYFEENNIKGVNELKSLFSTELNVVALNRWFRMATPDAAFSKKSVETYQQAINALNSKKTL